MSVRALWVVASIAMLTIADARCDMRAEPTWDMIGRAIEDGKNNRFCAKNPEHDRCKPMTAATLLMRCDSSDSREVLSCHATLYAMAFDAPASLPEWRCLPKGAAEHPEQLRLLFVREAHRLPEVLHQPARQLLYYAVIKAFPCPLGAR